LREHIEDLINFGLDLQLEAWKIILESLKLIETITDLNESYFFFLGDGLAGFLELLTDSLVDNLLDFHVALLHFFLIDCEDLPCCRHAVLVFSELL
jgi:hypothetical protein